MKNPLLKYPIFYLLFLAMLAFSCERDVHIKLPYAGDKIVLNAFLAHDSVVYARITRSAPNDTDMVTFPEISGCKADLYENEVFRETLVETNINGRKFYVSRAKIVSGAKYAIRVITSGFPEVEGADEVPVKPSFEPLEYWKLSNPADTNKPYKLTLKLKDPPGVKNYYRIKIFPASYNANTRRYSISRNSELSFGLENFIDKDNFFGVFDDNLYRTGYFTDETFDGKEITLNISLKAMSTDRPYIAPQVTTLSRQSFLYFDSKSKQVENNDNPFTEAVIVYSNIKGGYGIVGGMADSLAVIKRMN